MGPVDGATIGVVLFAIGLFALIVRHDLVIKLLALVRLTSGERGHEYLEATPSQREEMLKDAYKSLGGELEDPFMDLSFLALPVIPELKLTPKGLVRVAEQEIVSPLLEVI